MAYYTILLHFKRYYVGHICHSKRNKLDKMFILTGKIQT